MNVTELFHTATPRYPELKGKVALITGSSQGIGMGIAARLAAEGMRVVITGLDAEQVAAVTNDLRALGIEAIGVPGDLCDDDYIARVVDETMRIFGDVNVLVNNAADLKRTRLEDMDTTRLDSQMAVNIRAPMLLAQRAAAIMTGGSSVINISSVGGLRAHERPFPYDVTKGAIDAMTRALACELAPRNIRVNAVAPGSVFTSRLKQHLEKDKNGPSHNVPNLVPMGRRASLQEISAVVAFLASDEASYVTGQIIYVDGGVTAQLSPPGQPI